ncbi:Lipid A 3-O-deacylase (PagL) [Cognatiyoonia koreensis]|uniref:Lipid A 3-O-deacylase (PagL) n=1 Tax=Cognatiyoonia koreensis TaxID=364200 RepID=A0A1I0PBN1_9RHOB|nr:acyloxyacyl hydrolase [Cognatiyoonia koreensis]SEW10986.1 Lipid A 3-O-deacylase (PagL) [Cognatiyoonia koreensis]
MDGTLAGIFLIASLSDMGLNDCPTDCLRASDATARLSFQAAGVEFQDEIVGSEVLIGYDVAGKYGPFQPTIAASVTDENGMWIGAGAKWTTEDVFNGPLFIEAALMPGLYFDNAEVNLGGTLQFRSSLGVGYAFDNGSTVLVSYDHRSNADTQTINPGLETIAIRFAIALN